MSLPSGRHGARLPSLVPGAVLAAIETGAESANHMEQIAMDMGALLAWQFPTLADRAIDLRNGGLVGKMRTGGRLLLDEVGLDAACAGAAWSSDTARGWAAMAVGYAPDLALEQRLQLIRPFADDGHFAVREWAWLSMRPHVAVDVCGAIDVLGMWTVEQSERLRRFASEATRPRGVWSAHLPLLKSNPQLGLPILEPLRADVTRYVQDSVSNWLNDASKSRPDWVAHLCRRWDVDASDPATARICRRGQRSLRKPAGFTRPDKSGPGAGSTSGS